MDEVSKELRSAIDLFKMALNKGDGTGAWIRFFKEASIPDNDAAQYAIIFTDNRIQKTMLLDLNKEYLNDMGISRMGDVIAILKHAKTVCTMEARSRVLKESSDSPKSDYSSSHEVRTISKTVTVAKQQPAAAVVTKTMVAKASVAKATKTVNKMAAAARATQKAASAAATSAAAGSPTRGARDSPTQRRSTPASRLVGHFIGNDPGAHPMNCLTTKEKLSRDLACRLGPQPAYPSTSVSPDSDILSRLGAKKMRKVHSDPLGVSTTDESDSSQVRFKVTGFSSQPDSTQGSVFSRLGTQAPALKRPAQSTSPGDDELPYAGIFKSVPEKKAKPEPVAVLSSRARRPTAGILACESDSEPVHTVASSPGAAGGVMGRLGPAQASTQPYKPPHKRMIPTSPVKPVSSKLRMEAEVSSSADSTGSRSIFNRLGGK